MSLRIRLSLIVSMLFLTCMLLGFTFLISSARQRVVEEVDAAALLAYQLLQATLPTGATLQSDDYIRLQAALRGLDDVRHLRIQIAPIVSDTPLLPTPRAQAPSWFIYLVEPLPLKYALPLHDGSELAVVITSDPTAEIAEVWIETRNFMLVLLLVLLLLNSFLYITLGRWLAPVSAIVAGLEDAEHGIFSGHISQASLPEMKAIAEKLNQLTATLRSSKAENERLGRRSLQIQEEERRHLARELHDELGQSISAIKAIAFSIAQRTRAQDEMSAEGADRIGIISSHVSGHVRSMMGRLRPAILDELGLVPALQTMVDDWNRHHRETFCSFRVSGDFATLDSERQIGIYRIVQEALTNVAKHAGAERAEVTLERDANGYRMEIRDDGRGFTPGASQHGMGLPGIRERCQALNGSFSLFTAPGSGVRMHVEFH